MTLLVSVVLNVGCNRINMLIGSPFFMDSIFTASTAALFGPWVGMLAGFLSSMSMDLFFLHNGTAAAFFPCQMATGLIIGLFARRSNWGEYFEILIPIVLVALVNSLLGGIIATFLFGGLTGHGSDFLINGFRQAGQEILSASFFARLPINILDKTVAVVFAWLAYRTLVHDPATD